MGSRDGAFGRIVADNNIGISYTSHVVVEREMSMRS